jgi:hypothetical protein
VPAGCNVRMYKMSMASKSRVPRTEEESYKGGIGDGMTRSPVLLKSLEHIGVIGVRVDGVLSFLCAGLGHKSNVQARGNHAPRRAVRPRSPAELAALARGPRHLRRPLLLGRSHPAGASQTSTPTSSMRRPEVPAGFRWARWALSAPPSPSVGGSRRAIGCARRGPELCHQWGGRRELTQASAIAAAGRPASHVYGQRRYRMWRS